jgi:hypothetical protein
VSYHVSVLQNEGSLHREHGQPRTITEPGCPSLPGEDDNVEIPLIGQIAAGVPVDAAEAAEETFLLSRRLVGHGALFMLRVKGDSMTGAAIADGDLVVVRQQKTAENGEIVAAQLDRGRDLRGHGEDIAAARRSHLADAPQPGIPAHPGRRCHHRGQGGRCRAPCAAPAGPARA